MLTRQPGWFVWSWERAVGWPSHTQYPGNSTRTSTRGEASLCWCTPLPQLAMGRPPGPAATLLLTSPPHTAHLHACARTHSPVSIFPRGMSDTSEGTSGHSEYSLCPKALNSLVGLWGPHTFAGTQEEQANFHQVYQGELGSRSEFAVSIG